MEYDYLDQCLAKTKTPDFLDLFNFLNNIHFTNSTWNNEVLHSYLSSCKVCIRGPPNMHVS